MQTERDFAKALISGRVGLAPRVRSDIETAIMPNLSARKSAFVVGIILILTSSAALSQGRSVEAGAARPAVGIGSKNMNSCSADQRKFCATTASGVMKECLVANWNRIASDCQDALATPVDRIGGSGRSRSD